ncbi:MAG: DUF167 domain-containing protein [Sphingopyxis sp.]|uniref:DUF167 domain-containing protein n=1 Tax=Sphingopyxis sp. TaxID=1908224 RepID=UPI0032EC561D
MQVTPGARNETVRIEGGTVRLRVTAPPADGAANAAVLRLLASALAIPPSKLTLIRGATARVKLFAVTFD